MRVGVDQSWGQQPAHGLQNPGAASGGFRRSGRADRGQATLEDQHVGATGFNPFSLQQLNLLQQQRLIGA